MEIYLGIDGGRKGPFTPDQVRSLAAEGKAGRDTLAFRTGDAGWVKLCELPEILPASDIPPLPGEGIPSLPVQQSAGVPVGDSLSLILRRGALATSISTPVLWVLSGMLSTAASSHIQGANAGNLQDFMNQLSTDPSAQNSLVGVGLVGIVYFLSFVAGSVFAIWGLIRLGKGYRLGWIAIGIHALCFLLSMFR